MNEKKLLMKNRLEVGQVVKIEAFGVGTIYHVYKDRDAYLVEFKNDELKEIHKALIEQIY